MVQEDEGVPTAAPHDRAQPEAQDAVSTLVSSPTIAFSVAYSIRFCRTPYLDFLTRIPILDGKSSPDINRLRMKPV